MIHGSRLLSRCSMSFFIAQKYHCWKCNLLYINPTTPYPLFWSSTIPKKLIFACFFTTSFFPSDIWCFFGLRSLYPFQQIKNFLHNLGQKGRRQHYCAAFYEFDQAQSTTSNTHKTTQPTLWHSRQVFSKERVALPNRMNFRRFSCRCCNGLDLRPDI